MSFFSKKQSFALRVISILISVIIATCMWYMVSVRDKIEMQVDVNIDYINIPKNLIVTDGLIKKLTVRIRGPEALLRRGTGSQHMSHQIDLSRIKKGVTIVPLTAERLSGYYRAFDVLDVQPPRIVVKADNVVERTVPLQPEVRSTLRKGAVTISDVVLTPASVSIWGPESVVSEISNLPLLIEVDPQASGTTVQQSLTVDAPGLVTVTPKNIRVSYAVTSKRVTVTHKYRIAVSSENANAYAVLPREITLTVEVPESLAKNQHYLSDLKIDVVPPVAMKAGEETIVQVHYRVPDGMIVLQPKMDNVTIKRIEE